MNYDTWLSTEPDPNAYDERPEDVETCPHCSVRMDDDHHPDCPHFTPEPCDNDPAVCPCAQCESWRSETEPPVREFDERLALLRERKG